MKRENEDIPEGELQQQQQQLLEDIDGKDQKPPVKRPRSDEEEVRLLIPSKVSRCSPMFYPKQMSVSF